MNLKCSVLFVIHNQAVLKSDGQRDTQQQHIPCRSKNLKVVISLQEF